MTAKVHVEVVCVRPLQIGEHGDVLLYNGLLVDRLGLLLLLLDGLERCPEVPHIDEAVEGALANHGPCGGHSEAVHNWVLPLVTRVLGHDKVDHGGSVRKERWFIR